MTLLETIIEHEGFESKPYMDPLAIDKIPKDEYEVIAKNWKTIVPTFGHGLTYITEEESIEIVKNRIKERENELSNSLMFFKRLPTAVKEVLVEMSFQMGVTGTLAFKNTLLFLQKGKFEEASQELLDSELYRNKKTQKRALDYSYRLKNIGVRHK